MSSISRFDQLPLNSSLLQALGDLGFVEPSAIQAQSIPALLRGEDLMAQAHTGSGKTAAFGLSLLQKLKLSGHDLQALVLAPTRELAIQVAEALKSFAKYLSGFQVLPIYGGQDFGIQLKGLKRGPHVVVGTPGRIMDHIRRGSLALDTVNTVVLDEADEMLRMGFQEDVEWILQHVHQNRQMMLFSATMPSAIQRVAKQYLNNPTKIHVKTKTVTAASIDQVFMQVANTNKLEVLARYLEVEDFDAALIFARTKNMTIELAEKLETRGFSVAALNGDMSQSLREKVIDRLKRGSLDLVVATDVAARGLDVERISHVVNYDAPHDPESYVHRIGRTGRAGRSGKSLLFINPREHYLLRDIENTTQQQITQIDPPSVAAVQKKRSAKFAEKISQTLAKGGLDFHRQLVESLVEQCNASIEDIASALANLLQKQQFSPLAALSEEGAPARRPQSRSNFKSPAKSGGKFMGRPAGKSGAKSGGKSSKPRFAGKPSGKPSGKFSGKPGAKKSFKK